MMKFRHTDEPPLWDRKYRPEDITPEITKDLDIPGWLKLLKWFDKWAEYKRSKGEELTWKIIQG